MYIIDTVELFVNTDDEIKSLSRQKLKEMLHLHRFKEAESKLSVSELATLLILFHTSHCSSLKHFWFHHKYYVKEFSAIPSYGRFVIWINRFEKLFEYLLDKNLIDLNGQLGVIDSTKIETSKVVWHGKVHRQATIGYSSTGMFKGFKLHVLMDYRSHRLVKWFITQGSVHDITPVKEGFLENQSGRILADSGYVSRDLRFSLMNQNIDFVAKPRSNQDELDIYDFNLKYGKLYKKRMSIERLFSLLKRCFSLNTSNWHSSKSLFTHLKAALYSYQAIKNGNIAVTKI